MKRIDLGDGWEVEMIGSAGDPNEYLRADLLRLRDDGKGDRTAVSFRLRNIPGDPIQTVFLDKLEEAIGVIRREAGDNLCESCHHSASEHGTLGCSATAEDGNVCTCNFEGHLPSIEERLKCFEDFRRDWEVRAQTSDKQLEIRFDAASALIETLQERLDRLLLSYHEVYNGLASRVTALEGREERTADEPYWQTLRRRFSADGDSSWGRGYRQSLADLRELEEIDAGEIPEPDYIRSDRAWERLRKDAAEALGSDADAAVAFLEALRDGEPPLDLRPIRMLLSDARKVLREARLETSDPGTEQQCSGVIDRIAAYFRESSNA